MRSYPSVFLKIPVDFEAAQAPAGRAELELADRCREPFAFPKHGPAYMVDMVRAFRLLRGAQHYLEIGTFDKGNLAYASRILSPQALIIDVDIDPQPERSQKLAGVLQPQQRLVTIVGDSSDPKTLADVRQALDGRLLDGVFIDGNHTAAMVISDYASYAPLVRSGGCIFFHDVYWEGSPAEPGSCLAIAQIDRLVPVYVIFMDDPVHRFLPWQDKTEPKWGGVAMIRVD